MGVQEKHSWYGCGVVAVGIDVVDRQLVWVWWSGNWYGCSGQAIGMGGVGRQLVWL